MTDKIIIEKRPPKSPVAAGILSGFFPGSGALYNGQIEKAILYIIIFAGLITVQARSMGPQPFAALLLGFFYIFQIIDAVNGAKEINRRALLENGEAKAATAAKPAGPAALPATGSVFWGLVLMALGGIFLLANFELIDIDRIFDFWPVLVIVIGLKMIADYFSRKNA
jgi:hypothetical protein